MFVTKLTVQSINALPVSPCLLGEGPTWHAAKQTFFWVDILNGRLHNWVPSTQTHRSWVFEKLIGCVCVCQSGQLIIALSDEVILFDPEQGVPSIKHLCPLDDDRPDNRANDGKVDPWGRLFVGSMHKDAAENSGRLTCIDQNGHKTIIEENIGISNTLAWSKDKTKFYFADSTKQTIWEYPLDGNGMPIVADKKEFVKTDIEGGAPDGSSIDANDNLWNAQWNNSRIQCFSSKGQVIDELMLPVPLTTSCCFGGDDLTTIYVTTAKVGLPSDVLEDKPECGQVFEVKTNIKGQAAYLFQDK